MDFSITPEQHDLLERLDAFCEENLHEHEIQRWLQEGGVPDAFTLKYYQEGFADLGLPERMGGNPADVLTRVLLLERLALHAGATLPIQGAMLDASIISSAATNEQMDALLEQMKIAGRPSFSLAVTEPEAGSNSLNARTTAEEVDDGFVINGAKSFVTSGQYASHIALLAHDTALGDANADGHRPLTLFLVPRDIDGVDAIPVQKAGQKLIPTAELLFNNVHVGKDAVMGERGEAARIVLRTFDIGRVYICATTTGMAQAAFNQALSYALNRQVSGESILSFQQIQDLICTMQIKIDTMRGMLYRCARAFDEQAADAKLSSALLKRYVPTTAMEVADSAMQIMGSMGYLDSTKCARIWKECRGNRIAEGTDQLMTVIAAKRIATRAAADREASPTWRF